jgi:hypothetical protein
MSRVALSIDFNQKMFCYLIEEMEKHLTILLNEIFVERIKRLNYFEELTKKINIFNHITSRIIN